LGVRWRATLAALLVVAVALAAGTFALLELTSERIESSARDSAIARAESLEALVAAGALVDPLPGRDPELFAQVVDQDGAVVASDRAISGVPAVAEIDVAPGQRRLETLDDILEGFEDEDAGLEDQGPYAVVAIGVTLPSGNGTVLVAASLEGAAQAERAVLPLLGIGLPLLLVLVGLTVWRLTGRALRPVAEMSEEADRISALALDRRLTLPAAADELHELATTLNDMLERLEGSAIRQRRFVADASHELKSPLATMRTMVEVAAREGRDTDASLLDDLAAEIQRMQALVSDLLYRARHGESHSRVRREEVDLDQVAVAAAGTLGANTELQVHTTDINPVRVIGDPDRLMRLVRNLTDNAGRHAVSTVWLATSVQGEEAVLTVADDGPGVPAGEAERIFERFVRLDESRARDTGGAGLGLAVARAIARDHGGSLVMKDKGERGATFEIRLPAADDESFRSSQ
jgi:signal transduction histidine kinase